MRRARRAVAPKTNYKLEADLDVALLPFGAPPTDAHALDTRPAETTLYIEPLMIEISRTYIRIWRYTGKK